MEKFKQIKNFPLKFLIYQIPKSIFCKVKMYATMNWILITSYHVSSIIPIL